MMEDIAQIAVVTWLLVEVLHNLGPLKQLDNKLLALIMGLLLGVAGYFSGYLSGQPVDVFLKVVAAVLTAGISHELIAKPVTGNRV